MMKCNDEFYNDERGGNLISENLLYFYFRIKYTSYKLYSSVRKDGQG